jgi:hypothetical protein
MPVASAPTPSGVPALAVATSAYLLTCGVGLGVRRGVLRTDRARWVHHVLFVVTAASSALAVVALAAARDRAAALALLPAGLPFARLTRVSARTGPHARTAQAAAPAYAAAWALHRSARAARPVAVAAARSAR